MTTQATVSSIFSASAAALGAAALAGGIVLGTVATPASAATTYRYWSYWVADGSTWRYAVEGAGTRVPADGDVEGWRFGLAGQSADIQPAPAPDFARICGEQPERSDSKRVAVVIDPGISEHAPDGQTPGSVTVTCVVADPSATSLEILQSVATVRIDSGFVCGIDDYPTGECAPLVDDSANRESANRESANRENAGTQASQSTNAPTSSGPNAAEQSPSSAGTPVATAIAVSAVALIGFGLWRRSRARLNKGAQAGRP